MLLFGLLDRLDKRRWKRGPAGEVWYFKKLVFYIRCTSTKVSLFSPPLLWDMAVPFLDYQY